MTEIADRIESLSGLWAQEAQEAVADITTARNTALHNVTTALGIIDGNLNSLAATTNARLNQLKDLTAKYELELEAIAAELRGTTPVAKFPGQPDADTIRWGCSHQANGVPTSHEQAAGVPVGLRRTFWRLDQATKLVATCKADHAAGRLPYVSIKLSDTWENTAAGKLDAPLTSLIKAMDALGLPIWFSVHHEPEGGNGTAYPDEGQGSEKHWRAMQAHVRKLIDAAGAKNIAFGSTLMSWTFDSRSKRNPADYWVDGIWDFAGLDHYVDANATTVLSTMWKNALAFYKDKGIPVALGEWGNKDHTVTGAAEMQEWYEHLIDNGVVGACYFDTDLNGGVPLSGEALTKFRSLMKDPRSVTGF